MCACVCKSIAYLDGNKCVSVCVRGVCAGCSLFVLRTNGMQSIKDRGFRMKY